MHAYQSFQIVCPPRTSIPGIIIRGGPVLYNLSIIIRSSFYEHNLKVMAHYVLRM